VNYPWFRSQKTQVALLVCIWPHSFLYSPGSSTVQSLYGYSDLTLSATIIKCFFPSSHPSVMSVLTKAFSAHLQGSLYYFSSDGSLWGKSLDKFRSGFIRKDLTVSVFLFLL